MNKMSEKKMYLWIIFVILIFNFNKNFMCKKMLIAHKWRHLESANTNMEHEYKTHTQYNTDIY